MAFCFLFCLFVVALFVWGGFLVVVWLGFFGGGGVFWLAGWFCCFFSKRLKWIQTIIFIYGVTIHSEQSKNSSVGTRKRS